MLVVALVNLVSCYSQKEITYSEFYDLPQPTDATVITNDNIIINLTSDSIRYNYIKWNLDSDTLTIYSTHLEKAWSTALRPVSDTVWYSKNEISKVEISEFDETKTIFAIAIPITIIVLMVIGINNMTLSGIGGEN